MNYLYIIYALAIWGYLSAMYLTARYIRQIGLRGHPLTLLLLGGGFWWIMVPMLVIANSLSKILLSINQPE